MARSASGREPEELGFGGWFGFWLALVILGFLAIIGAIFAAEDADPGDYACGLTLTIASLLLAFLRIKNRFDGGPADWASFLLVDDMANLLPAIIVFVILGFVGIYLASEFAAGGLQNAGVALFIVAVLGALLSIKRVFDVREHHS